MDAVSAAKDRIDKALSKLERKVLELKARAAGAGSVGDDDLFAPLRTAAADDGRVAELEAAGQQASQALADAAEQIRHILSERA